jgi:hypothetical protein
MRLIMRQELSEKEKEKYLIEKVKKCKDHDNLVDQKIRWVKEVSDSFLFEIEAR